MDAKKMLEQAKYTVPIIDSNMKILSETLDQLKKINESIFLHHSNKSLDELIEYLEGVIEDESKNFQRTVSLIGQLENPRHKTLLYLRFIENKKISEIKDTLDLESSAVFKGISEAIAEMDEILEKQRSEDDLQAI